MKTVWVNRINADGTAKLLSEWEQISVRDDTTHARVQWGEIWQASEKGCEHIWDDSKAVCFEYVGNQRGDGRFYIEDGHLPPDTREFLIVVWLKTPSVPCITWPHLLLLNNDDVESWMPLCPNPQPSL